MKIKAPNIASRFVPAVSEEVFAEPAKDPEIEGFNPVVEGESLKSQVPKAEVPKVEVPKTEIPKPQVPKAEVVKPAISVSEALNPPKPSLPSSTGSSQNSVSWFAIEDTVEQWEKEAAADVAKRTRLLYFPKDGDRIVLARPKFLAAIRIHILKFGLNKFETVTCSRSSLEGCRYCDASAGFRAIGLSSIRYIYEVCHLQPFTMRNGEVKPATYKYWLAPRKVHEVLSRLIARYPEIYKSVISVDVTGVSPQINYSFVPTGLTQEDARALKTAKPFPENHWVDAFCPEPVDQQMGKIRRLQFASVPEDSGTQDNPLTEMFGDNESLF